MSMEYLGIPLPIPSPDGFRGCTRWFPEHLGGLVEAGHRPKIAVNVGYASKPARSRCLE